MATVRFSLDPDAARQTAHDAVGSTMPDDQDNPVLSDEEVLRFTEQRLTKSLRSRLGLTQQQFAERFHISYGRVRDIEQGRHRRSDTALVAYLRVIENNPQAVLEVLSAA